MNSWIASRPPPCARAGRMDGRHARAGAQPPASHAAGRSRAARRQDRHGRPGASRGAGDGGQRRHDCRGRSRIRRSSAYIGAGHTRDRAEGRARGARLHRRARATSPASARRRRNLKLAAAKNWDEIVRMVGDAAKKAQARRVDHRPRLASGKVVGGAGGATSKAFPCTMRSARVSPDNPVWLTHASGHAGFANALAMKAAEVTQDDAGSGRRQDSAGDKDGKPTGLLQRDGAVARRRRARRATARRGRRRRPRPTSAATSSSPSAESLSKGLTTIHDAGSPPSTMEVMKRIVDEGKRRCACLDDAARGRRSGWPPTCRRYRLVDYGDKRFTVRGIKRAIDGALGSRGAWLLEPYADLATTTGLNTDSLDDIRTIGRAGDHARLSDCASTRSATAPTARR